MKWDEFQIWCRCQCLCIILTKEMLIFLPLDFRFDRVEADHFHFDEKLFRSRSWRFSWTYLQLTVFLLNPGCLMTHLGRLCLQRRSSYNSHHHLFLDRCYIYLLNSIGLPKPATGQPAAGQICPTWEEHVIGNGRQRFQSRRADRADIRLCGLHFRRIPVNSG